MSRQATHAESRGRSYLALWVILLFAAGCQEDHGPAVQQRPSGAGVLDACVVEQLPAIFTDERRELQHTFTVTNQTRERVRFERVSHSCGCAGAALDKQELAPNEQTSLRVKVSLVGRRGEQLFACKLHLDSGRVWTYELHTTLVERVAFSPAEIHFGAVDPSRPLKRSAELKTHSPLASPPPPDYLTKLRVQPTQIARGRLG